MAIIKCKMCGGDIELAADKTYGMCEFCGSTMTLPKIDDDQRAAAFNRGNHFRRIGEFDKALAVYERIVREDDTDAEAHWCCALCRFGIEYVEDPVTLEYIPTCHRASFDSFLEDVDYQAAVKHSDGITKRQYQKDAAKIAEVQRGILATSQNAEPYDVFICYKETDANGDRTRDSLMAQDIYYQLTEQGRKVFFARITLEDVVGTQYEPYIFAALNSAKVMVVVGTKPEYLNAVWVKNEWSRFLAMMKKDRSKLLLPCYRDMDPYDLPEQLSVLQSYDMSKIGFIQDLIRGVAKVLDAQKKTAPVKETVVVQQTAANTAPLLKRAFIFLEDGDWNSANEYCEKVLDMDPECAEAYLGKLMVGLKVCKQEDLKDQPESFADSSNYQKALRFSDEKLRNILAGYIDHINQNMANGQKDEIYNAAQRLMAGSSDINYQYAIRQLEKIPGWRDSDEQIELCRKKIAEFKQKKAARSRRNLKIALLLFVAVIVAGAAYWGLEFAKPLTQYRDATNLMKAGQYQEAIDIFVTLDGFMDSEENIRVCETALRDCRYDEAVRLMDQRKYHAAIDAFRSLNGYRDSHEMLSKCQEALQYDTYRVAQQQMDSWKYTEALNLYWGLGDYRDSFDKMIECGKHIPNVLDKRRQLGSLAIHYYKHGKQAKAMEIWDTIAARQTISAGGYHTVALKNDGTVMVAGGNLDPWCKPIYQNGQCNVQGWENIVAIAAGGFHTVGLKADGTVVATGYNAQGQCNVSSWKHIVSIAAGDEYTVGLKADGTVVYTGNGVDAVSRWSDIVAIAGGWSIVVGLKSDGTMVCTSTNKIPDDNSNIVDVVVGTHVAYLTADGTGHSPYFKSTQKITRIFTGNNVTLGIQSDGTVIHGGAFSAGEFSMDLSKWDILKRTDIVGFSANNWHAVFLFADGTAAGYGDNLAGRCNVYGWCDIKMPQ